MFESPETFLKSYRSAGLPLFYVRKGESGSGKRMLSFTKKFDIGDAAELEERTGEGYGLLDEFFEKHGYGEVNIETMRSVTGDRLSRNTHYVSWGEKPQRYGKAGNNGRQASENMVMVQMMMNMQQSQTTLILGMMDKSNQQARENDRDNFKLMLKNTELKRDLEDSEAADPREMLMMESIGMVKPITAAIVAKSNPVLAASIMSTVDRNGASPSIGGGMQKTVPGSTAEKEGAPATTGPKKPAFHPMRGYSMDLATNCIRAIMMKLFPEYPVNEVLPAFVALSGSGVQANLFKGAVENIIKDNRQKATSENAAPGAEKEAV